MGDDENIGSLHVMITILFFKKRYIEVKNIVIDIGRKE